MSDMPEKIYAWENPGAKYEAGDWPDGWRNTPHELATTYTRSDLCIPLPVLPDEMEDGYEVGIWGDYRISVHIIPEEKEGNWMFPRPPRGSYACYRVEPLSSRLTEYLPPCVIPLVATILQLPELEVQDGKIVRKG